MCEIKLQTPKYKYNKKQLWNTFIFSHERLRSKIKKHIYDIFMCKYEMPCCSFLLFMAIF